MQHNSRGDQLAWSENVCFINLFFGGPKINLADRMFFMRKFLQKWMDLNLNVFGNFLWTDTQAINEQQAVAANLFEQKGYLA